jgi:class 3 adenylate cyclase/tetratricopeptide (TPR) repeat protein
VLACPSCGQENPDGFKFCGACGSSLTALVEEAASEEERKVVTALFTDIVGSTASAEQLDPEDVRARLAPYYARVRKELESFGGTVEKFIGDAVVALFGAPVAHEDDPERAVRAALAVNDAVAELNELDEWFDIHIRTAVHTGEALVVVGAKAVEGEGMAAGDVMNTAARLQGGAPVDGIAVGEATYRATAHVIEYEPGEPLQAKGKAQPIPIWVVVGTKEAPAQPAVHASLVGRSAELGRLLELWEEVVETRRPRLVTLLGPPGIGKSRLLVALCDRVAEAATVHWGRCLPYGEGMTYWPVTEIVKSAAGIRHDEDAESDSVKLGSLLESLPTSDEEELRTIAAALANLVGAATTPRGTYSAESISQAELHWAIRRMLPLLANERPMLLIFEDLHWAEPTLIELLQELAAEDADGAFLVLGSARPELAESHGAFVADAAGRESMALSPLDEDQIEELLTELLEDMSIESADLQRLARNAGGNPLFLEETVRMIADAEGEVDLESLRVPETVQALIGSRLDALPTDDKRVAQQASVVGNVFWPGAVAHVGRVVGDLRPRLDALERRDFVHERPETTVVGEREYAFKHILIRDVAYERLPKGRRAELHVRFVDWLRELGTGDEFVEIEAYHLEQACVHARAVARAPIAAPTLDAAQTLRRSAEKAKRREGTREAHRFFTRALDLLDDEHAELRTELTLGRARIVDALGDLRLARAEYEQVAAEAAEVSRPDLVAAALLALANLDGRQGHPEDARARVSEAGRIADELGDAWLQVRAMFESSHVLAWYEGDVERAIEALQRALELTEAMDDLTLTIEAYMRIGTLFLNVGELSDAEAALRRATTLASEEGSVRDEVRATSLLAYVTYFRDLDEAERLALRAVDGFERISDSLLQVQNLRLLAKCALARGKPKLAEEYLRGAVPLALEGGGWLVVEVYRYLVETLVEQGRMEDARDLAAFAARSVPEEDPYARAAAVLAGALVAAADGEHVTASTGFSEALGVLEQQQLLIDLGESRIAFARALRSLGETTGAITELERARQIFSRMGATAVLDAIRPELEELRAGADVVGPRSASS